MLLDTGKAGFLAQESSRKRNRALIGNSYSINPEITVSLDGTILNWNGASGRKFGFLGDDVENMEPTVQEGWLVAQTVDKKGEALDLFLALFPLSLVSGKSFGVVGIALKGKTGSVARSSQALESLPVGIIVADGPGSIVLANFQIERLLGYQRHELFGQRMENLLQNKDFVAGVLPQGSNLPVLPFPSFTSELKKEEIGHNGKSAPAFAAILTQIDYGSSSMKLEIVSTAVRNQNMAGDLVKHTDSLLSSNVDLENFTYMAAHDLQEPLREVAVYCQMLGTRHQGQLDDSADKYINYIVDGVTRMRQLVNDLLIYARIDTLGDPFELTDANEVFSSVLKQLYLLIQEAHAEINCGSLPTVKVDKSQLSRVFQNLIINAIKFRGEAVPRVECNAVPLEGRWCFSVTDNGMGIDEGNSEHIFQMFQRLPLRERKAGSGIGLAIARKIVERHGGRIWYESTPGHGTTFYFTMPSIEEGGR